MKFDHKLFIEKCTRLINLCGDWGRFPLKLLNIKNIDDFPGKHGFFISPLFESMTGLDITHSVNFMGEKFDRRKMDKLPVFQEELEWHYGAKEIRATRTQVEYEYDFCSVMDLERYSLIVKNSIIDFDELFRKLDLLLVETV